MIMAVCCRPLVGGMAERVLTMLVVLLGVAVLEGLSPQNIDLGCLTLHTTSSSSALEPAVSSTSSKHSIAVRDLSSMSGGAISKAVRDGTRGEKLSAQPCL